MKRLLLFILILGFAGCETERILFSGPYHVRFTKAAQAEKESNSQIIKIEVHNAGPEIKKDVTVNYSISGDAREGVDYQILGTKGRVVIGEGEYFGYIEIKLLNNANNILRSQDLIFTLISANSSELQVGQGEGGIGKKFTLTIQDDCILGGTYDGTVEAFSVPTKGIKVTSTDCETYYVSNWNLDFWATPFDMGLSFMDNGDNTLTIPKQEQTQFDELATLSGVGSVNPLTKEIYFTFTLRDYAPTANPPRLPIEYKIKLMPEN